MEYLDELNIFLLTIDYEKMSTIDIYNQFIHTSKICIKTNQIEELLNLIDKFKNVKRSSLLTAAECDLIPNLLQNYTLYK